MPRVIILLVAFIFLTALVACTSSPRPGLSPEASTARTPNATAAEGNQAGQTPVAPLDTEFSRMLSLVPYSFLDDHDIWFGDPERAKELAGIQGVGSLDALKQLSLDERKRVSAALQGVAGAFTINNWQQLAPVTGYDVWSVDRSVFVLTPPPWSFSVAQGSFKSGLITNKLTELGYQKVEYDSDSYFALNDDFSPGNLSSPVSQQVLAAMNRVAALDNMVITAPATAIMTGILDTLAGQTTPVIDAPAGRALASSLGPVLSAVIMNPVRTLNPNPPQVMPPFKFTVPSDWGQLHQYSMSGIGFKTDGKDRYWITSLYYENPTAAAADADTLVRRVRSYILNTQFEQTPGQSFKTVPLTDKFDVGQPVVRQYTGQAGPGATLTLECRYKTDTPGSYWQIPLTEFRDFLFLAPDPAPYVVK